MDESSKNRIWDNVEAIVLICLCVALAVQNVPAQWTGVSSDPSFTAWVAPISNRLAHGPRLYEWGTHMPLPPLSHVVLYLVSWGKAVWLTESLAHHLVTAASVLMMYFFLRPVLPRHVSFLAAMAALPTNASCDVILFYNSLTNFLVTALALASTAYFRSSIRQLNGPVAGSGRYSWLWLPLMGCLSSAALLSKQSIGGLAIIGCAMVVVMTPTLPLWMRARNLLAYGICTGLAFGLLLWVMSPWVNPEGLINDVFIIGSQCKGGTKEVVQKVANYNWFILAIFCVAFFAMVLIAGSGLLADERERPPRSLQRARNLAWLSLAGFVGFIFALFKGNRFFLGICTVHDVGMALCLMSVAAVALPTLPALAIRPDFGGAGWQTLACMTCVLLGGAMGYGLSAPLHVYEFGWNIHTIPMFQVGLAALFWGLLASMRKLTAPFPRPLPKVLVTTSLACMLLFNWLPWPGHYQMIKECTEVWSDCPWLAGARVITTANPLHQALSRMHDLAGTNGTVLLLPEDPHLQECVGAERPTLSCAIVYSDQYWPRYVTKDFQALQNSPPKVIAIAPEKNWRIYGETRNDNLAAEELIDLVLEKLLPQSYHLAFRQKIHYGDAGDTIAVYVRNE